MDFNTIYFTTSSIFRWQNLLETTPFKEIITESLAYLVKKQKIQVYAFVIMPNHIHLIWELLEMNNKEKPNVSFMKFTSHQFLKTLRKSNPNMTNRFRVFSEIRSHQFWQDKSLHVELYSRYVLEQKLDYLHHNPVAGKYQLARDYLDYPYSSSRFYEIDDDIFDFLTHYMDRI